jgi:hypothetical protein
MNITHIISTTDSINSVNITDLNNRPHIVEGDKANDLTIYIENSTTLQTYLDIPAEPRRGI